MLILISKENTQRKLVIDNKGYNFANKTTWRLLLLQKSRVLFCNDSIFFLVLSIITKIQGNWLKMIRQASIWHASTYIPIKLNKYTVGLVFSGKSYLFGVKSLQSTQQLYLIFFNTVLLKPIEMFSISIEQRNKQYFSINFLDCQYKKAIQYVHWMQLVWTY